MIHHLIDRVGDWNPQLFRELKGRLKGFNVAIAVAISLLGQLVLFLYQLRELPGERHLIVGKYCRLRSFYEQERSDIFRQSNNLHRQLDGYRNTQPSNPNIIQELQSQIAQLRTKISDLDSYLSKNFCPTDQLDMQVWWREHWEYIFLSLSVIFIFTLLVAGTCLLINNLATEERRGTLNFIRLSPQSETSILTGKMLGVPILIYLVILAAAPLHFIAGRAANIATSDILSFWVVLVAGCIFFYSAALLFGLVGSRLGNSQAWLGSGAVLGFLILTMGISTTSYFNSTTWLKLLNPFGLIPHLSTSSFFESFTSGLERFKWFNLPLGDSIVTIVGFVLLNYGILTWFIWQSLRRCFRDKSATMLSKPQSYLLTLCFVVLTIGCANYTPPENRSPYAYPLWENLWALSTLNLLLFLYLIAAITPHRQTLQDWARYRRQKLFSGKIFGYSSLVKDLIWGEKSPTLVAIAINVVIAITPLALFTLLWPAKVEENKTHAFLCLVSAASLIMIYASVAQLLLFMRTQQRTFWTVGTLGAAIVLRPVFSGAQGLLLFNPFALLAYLIFPYFPIVGTGQFLVGTIVLLGQVLILVLLNLQLTRQLRQAGESTSKPLFRSAK